MLPPKKKKKLFLVFTMKDRSILKNVFDIKILKFSKRVPPLNRIRKERMKLQLIQIKLYIFVAPRNIVPLTY